MELVEKLLPTGNWRYPIILLFILIAAFPNTRKAWYEFKHRQAQLDHLKQRLEIAKLRCEIEALVKQHGLSVPQEVSQEAPSPVSKAQASQPMPESISLTRSEQFVWGLLGAVFPIFLSLIQRGFSLGIPSLSSSFIVIAAFSTLLGGLWAIALDSRSPWLAMYNGVTFPVLFGWLSHSVVS